METKNNILLVCGNCQSVIKSVKTIKETQTFTEIKECLYCKFKIKFQEGIKRCIFCRKGGAIRKLTELLYINMCDFHFKNFEGMKERDRRIILHRYRRGLFEVVKEK